jgi:transcriptional antiterminator NusG
VTHLVGPKNQPAPLQEDEVRRILDALTTAATRRCSKLFRVGDPGQGYRRPFTEFVGMVEEVNHEKKKLKVMVSIRQIDAAELDFLQVELEK